MRNTTEITVGRASRFGLTALAAIVLAACGGGGDSGSGLPPPASPATAQSTNAALGLYRGTFSNNRTAYAAVLGNGKYWIMYSLPSNASVLGGMITGMAAADAGVFTANNAVDLSHETGTVSIANIEGSYTSQASLSATARYANGILSLATTYDPNSKTAAATAGIAGTFVGDAVRPTGNDRVTVTVAANGSLQGSGTSGCKFQGKATPRTDVNVFDLTVTMQNALCPNSGTVHEGIAFYDPTTARLYSSAHLLGANTVGLLLLATKTASATVPVTPAPVTPTPSTPSTPTPANNSKAVCADFRYQQDAQAAYFAGARQLDGDNDGIACESLPRR